MSKRPGERAPDAKEGGWLSHYARRVIGDRRGMHAPRTDASRAEEADVAASLRPNPGAEDPAQEQASPRQRASEPMGRTDSYGDATPRALGAMPVVPSYGPGTYPHVDAEGEWTNGKSGEAAHAHSYAPDDRVRPHIKVRILTWNMHGSIPKGDLEVLLGHVGEYVRPPDGWDEHTTSVDPGELGCYCVGQEDRPRAERIPPLPLDDAHPYHIVVIAGQECPWANNNYLMQSLHTAGDLGGIARTRSRAMHKFKELSAPAKDAKLKELGLDPRHVNEKMLEEDPVRYLADASTSSITSLAGSAAGSAGADEDAAIAAPRRNSRQSLNVDTSASAVSASVANAILSPEESPSDTLFGRGWSEVCEHWFCRAKTDPACSSASHLGHMSSSWSLSRAYEQSGTRSATAPPSETGSSEDTHGAMAGHLSPSTDTHGFPMHLGPYRFLIKERMMGCYSAVYVWRGCYDRVRGASSNIVKSGLLAGRMGNKGAVGISVKLGETRLLFINSHLAAHAKRVDARIANINKIKTELVVDTFLPENDPRRAAGDITEQFDHTFWCGDMNFRLDITRKHADWLIMNRTYRQALEFDQLRAVLRDTDALRGFHEAPIRFPPTYKYDLIKAAYAKRSAREQSRLSSENLQESAQELHAQASSNSLTGLSQQSSAGHSSAPVSPDSPTLHRKHSRFHLLRKRTRDLPHPGSTEQDPKQASGSSTANSSLRHRTSDTSISRASETSSIAEEVATRIGRMSLDSDASLEDSPLDAAPSLSNTAEQRAETSANAVLSSPQALADFQRQLYDTSAKQRVPSWCDRVLWRSTVAQAAERGERKRRIPLSRRGSSSQSVLTTKGTPSLSMTQTEPTNGESGATTPIRTAIASHVPSTPMQALVYKVLAPVEWLQSSFERSRPTADTWDESAMPGPVSSSAVGPQRGEVLALSYWSPDDDAMLALRAYSDHRPVVFAGAIGI